MGKVMLELSFFYTLRFLLELSVKGVGVYGR